MKEIKDERQNGGRTLVFIYYGGHGAMDNRTYSIMGDGTTVELEKIIRGLSVQEDSYWLALFDCCRDDIKLSQMSIFRTFKFTRGAEGYHKLDD